ncbi:MAG: hypothetical protein ACD_56C00036G0005 [uncultured bacterium]|nr:MAG: hypothetical protein ACD_56C00036G0005 [uncultured bacterium]
MKQSREIKNKKGFTLIELLITIAIIGILAGVILVSTSTSRTKANIAKAKSDINSIAKAIQMAQIQTGKVLLQITGSNCSDCVCRPASMSGPAPDDLRNLPATNACYTRWITTLNNLETVSGATGLAASYARDPWGSPYLLDENEKELGCTKDNLLSAGPDGDLTTTSDNIHINIPFIQCLN